MLTQPVLEGILSRIPALTIGVLGDLFLDRYLDIDPALTEPSLETGLDAYQVIRVRSHPGASGTVINNLVALGVRHVHPIAVIGDDGEGYELREALKSLRCVSTEWVLSDRGRRTPTYTKPLVLEKDGPPRELNRLDIKNRDPLPDALEGRITRGLADAWPGLDALVVLDQVSEPDCGVVTAGVRERLGEMGAATPQKVILADSRERIGRFSSVWLKPNLEECRRAVAGEGMNPEQAAHFLAQRAGRPVFCTRGADGILVVDPRRSPPTAVPLPAYPVTGPIDPVGAGDSTSAALVCALASGASPEQAAAFGNLVASVTIQQLGTTGTATPAQVWQRWQTASGP